MRKIANIELVEKNQETWACIIHNMERTLTETKRIINS